MQITVAANTAPVVDAGADQVVYLPATTAALDATVTDDNLPSGTLTTTWATASGSGVVTFANASAVDTTASFSAAGTYVLRLTASDGALGTQDVVTVVSAPVLTGKLFAGSSSFLYEIDPVTGATTTAATNMDFNNGYGKGWLNLAALSEGPVQTGTSGGSIWACPKTANGFTLIEIDAFYTGQAMAAGSYDIDFSALPVDFASDVPDGMAYSAVDNAFYVSSNVSAALQSRILKIDATTFQPVAWGFAAADNFGVTPGIDG